jgi:hypothetical protein
MTFTAGPGTRTLVYSSSGGATTLGPLTLTGGTITTSTPVIDATQTWNNAATTFTGIRFDVTDTASAAGSLLMDLRVGGASRLSVDKGGNFNAVGTGFFQSTLTAGSGFVAGSGSFSVTNTFNTVLWLGAAFGWASSTTVNTGTTPDLSLFRDGADTLAQRRGVNAQFFRIYNTFTDASNYERLAIRWSSNILNIAAERAGTGTQRVIHIDQVELIGGGNPELLLYKAFNSITPTVAIYGGTGSGDYLRFNTVTLDFYPAAAASWSIGRTALPFKNLFLRDYIETKEMTAPAAPAANSVRIYAVDNGSGKTQLMALFATGAAQQIAIEP